jgi:alkylation response protein AidB-like acyl-CoA dehydrogenase
MDFELSEDQQLLEDALNRWLRDHYDFAQRQKVAGGSPEHWRALAELGVLGLQVPVEHAGLGAGAVETYLVMRALGRALVIEPYVSTAVIGTRILARAGSAAQQAAHLPAIAAGQRRLALAALEPQGRFDLVDVATAARAEGDGFVLDGAKAVVLDGDSADCLLVSARTAGDRRAADGIELFLVDAKQRGVMVRGFPTIDGRRTAEVSLSGVAVGAPARIGTARDGLELIEWGVDCALAALCAEAVGVMEQTLELTLEHLRTRKQFGQPIGRLQALQHRVAEMATAIEQARSLALRAAAAVDSADRDERRRALSAAKFMSGRSGRFVGQQSVQLHGGMGMADEHPIGHYFKRLTAIDLAWGNAEHHLGLYGGML